MLTDLETYYEVTDCAIIAPYTLRLAFNDQSIREINFLPVLQGKVFQPLHQIEFFNQVAINPETGTIEWPNGADFNPTVLHDWDAYQEKLANRQLPVAGQQARA